MPTYSYFERRFVISCREIKTALWLLYSWFFRQAQDAIRVRNTRSSCASQLIWLIIATGFACACYHVWIAIGDNFNATQRDYIRIYRVYTRSRAHTHTHCSLGNNRAFDQLQADNLEWWGIWRKIRFININIMDIPCVQSNSCKYRSRRFSVLQFAEYTC